MKLILIAIVSAIAISSCNTMIGIGRDTRILGEGVEKTAAERGGAGGGGDVSGAPVY
jgi:predicted small secreted protein